MTLVAQVDCLEKGALCRSTGHTSMNDVSSRSHAIFTVHVDQKMRAQQQQQQRDAGADAESSDSGPAPEELVSSKFHFVDLAGRCGRSWPLLLSGNIFSARGPSARRRAVRG
jgi:hypothetical protein